MTNVMLQGSVSVPLLFAMYINDLDRNVDIVISN